MALILDARVVAERLEQDPLRNIVLLKHLKAFPDHTRAVLVTSEMGHAALVLLDAHASDYDRNAYPEAARIALIVSTHRTLTEELLKSIPKDSGLVFKLAKDDDRDVIGRSYQLERKTSYLSFTSAYSSASADTVVIANSASDAMFDMYLLQSHSREWLEPLLASDRAFTCAIMADGKPASVCLAYENHGRIWEVGGVITSPPYRGRGLASRLVRAALAELKRRDLVPRYQVKEDNLASIGVARSIGMTHFLTITHYLHVR